jgi:hypothetical protein
MVGSATDGNKKELSVKALFRVVADDVRDDGNYGFGVLHGNFFSSLSKKFPRNPPTKKQFGPSTSFFSHLIPL